MVCLGAVFHAQMLNVARESKTPAIGSMAGARCAAIQKDRARSSAEVFLQEFCRQHDAFFVDAVLKAGAFVQFGVKAVGGQGIKR